MPYRYTTAVHYVNDSQHWSTATAVWAVSSSNLCSCTAAAVDGRQLTAAMTTYGHLRMLTSADSRLTNSSCSYTSVVAFVLTTNLKVDDWQAFLLFTPNAEFASQLVLIWRRIHLCVSYTREGKTAPFPPMCLVWRRLHVLSDQVMPDRWRPMWIFSWWPAEMRRSRCL